MQLFRSRFLHHREKTRSIFVNKHDLWDWVNKKEIFHPCWNIGWEEVGIFLWTHDILQRPLNRVHFLRSSIWDILIPLKPAGISRTKESLGFLLTEKPLLYIVYVLPRVTPLAKCIWSRFKSRQLWLHKIHTLYKSQNHILLQVFPNRNNLQPLNSLRDLICIDIFATNLNLIEIFYIRIYICMWDTTIHDI